MNKSRRSRSRSPGLRNKAFLSSGNLNEKDSLYTSRRTNSENTKHLHYKDRLSKKHRGRIYDDEYNTSNIKYNRNVSDSKNVFDEEESYLTATSNSYKNIKLTPVGNKLDIKTCMEDSQRDPSTCNFQGNFFHPDTETAKQDDSKICKGGQNATELCDRLEHLEKLVETLLKSSTKTSTQTNIYEDNFPSERDAFELIPRNSTFTTSMWLNKIDEECIKRDFDEKTSIIFIQSKMTGIMKAWFKTLSPFDITWPELKMLITETFPDNIDFAATLKLLVERNIKFNETIQHYYYSKMYLLEACRISGENAVSCLLDGLEHYQLKEEGKIYNFKTPEALYSQFLSKLPEYKLDDNHFNSEKQEEVEVFKPEFKPKIKKCFTCKKYGHLDVDCRHAPICYNCKRTGHIALNCPLNY